MLKKKKGQIVPRYIATARDRKTQHLLKFGCDVEIVGATVRAVSPGPIIVIPSCRHVLKKKRQRRVKGFTVKGIHLVGYTGAGGLSSAVMCRYVGPHAGLLSPSP